MPGKHIYLASAISQRCIMSVAYRGCIRREGRLQPFGKGVQHTAKNTVSKWRVNWVKSKEEIYTKSFKNLPNNNYADLGDKSIIMTF